MSNYISVLTRDEFTALIKEAVRTEFQRQALLTKPVDPDPLVKIDEICELLKVSKVTIHKWKAEGKIPFRRISNRIFFKKSDVLEALKKIEPPRQL
jgi:excisionase family DNA binding protein